MSIGDTLAEARGQAGLTVTQVSQQTRIRESIIRSIEQGDFSVCGGDFYARGHIRSVAGVVGADPAPLIRDYDAEHGSLGGLRAAEIFEPATPIKMREPHRAHLGKVLAVVLLAVVGFGVYHLVTARGSQPAAAAATRPAVRPVVAAAPKASAKPSAKAKPKGEAVIRLTATSDCWVGLDDASGQSLYAGTVPAGQSMTWNEKHPVSLVLGNPSGIELSVNGKSQPMDTTQPVRLTIDPKRKTLVKVG